jgi:hypothetical protein
MLLLQHKYAEKVSIFMLNGSQHFYADSKFWPFQHKNAVIAAFLC